MQLKRTIITVRFTIKKKAGWLSNWSKWYNITPVDWIRQLGSTKGQPEIKDTTEQDRIELVKLARQMETQLFTNETIKKFKKLKLSLPFGFVVSNVYRNAVSKNDPEEICISGYGSTKLLEKWLAVKNYNYNIVNTY